MYSHHPQDQGEQQEEDEKEDVQPSRLSALWREDTSRLQPMLQNLREALPSRQNSNLQGRRAEISEGALGDKLELTTDRKPATKIRMNTDPVVMLATSSSVIFFFTGSISLPLLVEPHRKPAGGRELQVAQDQAQNPKV